MGSAVRASAGMKLTGVVGRAVGVGAGVAVGREVGAGVRVAVGGMEVSVGGVSAAGGPSVAGQPVKSKANNNQPQIARRAFFMEDLPNIVPDRSEVNRNCKIVIAGLARIVNCVTLFGDQCLMAGDRLWLLILRSLTLVRVLCAFLRFCSSW
ncbi:MAG: hypothetical protein BWY63_01999 [Chloroflexi bacterium ADurb.Bin360]|nr:MAG: hypothetical protein BWY63_01999 [Chloroflexi bacterium ADurb.Bin360]